MIVNVVHDQTSGPSYCAKPVVRDHAHDVGGQTWPGFDEHVLQASDHKTTHHLGSVGPENTLLSQSLSRCIIANVIM